VFLSGGGPSGISAWNKVYPKLSSKYSVFAYNRLGSGKSSKSKVPQSGKYIVATLHTLLHKKKIKPPYILVGHSLGGLYANLYARLYPEDLAGVVMVDSSHPEQFEKFKKHNLETGGLMRFILKAYKKINPTKYSEIEAFPETAKFLKQAPRFPKIPLVVISAAKKTNSKKRIRVQQIMHSLHKKLAKLAPNSRHIFATRSGHNIQREQPEIIIEAVHWLMNLN